MKEIHTRQEFIGTAAERALYTTTNLGHGAYWRETDSGKLYEWSGTAWVDTSTFILGETTCNAGTDLNTSGLATETGGNLAIIAGDTTSLDGKIPSKGQATMDNSSPVVIASNQTDVPVTLDGEDVTSGTPDNFNTNANLQVGDADVSATNPVPCSDAGPSAAKTQTYATSADATSTALDVTGAPAAGQQVVIDDWLLSVDTSMTLTVRSKTSETVFAKLGLTAGVPCQITLRDYLTCPDADEAVEVLASVAGNIYSTCNWRSE